MYKSRLYTKMRIWPGVSAQVFRNRAEIGRILRDLYMELSIRGRFPVQAGLVQKTIACKEEGALERINGNSLDIHAEKDNASEFGKHIGRSGIGKMGFEMALKLEYMEMGARPFLFIRLFRQ